jgi:uncharacterized protein VirK/YbjX
VFGLPLAQVWNAINPTLQLKAAPARGLRSAAAMLWACARSAAALRRWHRLALNPRFALMVQRHPLLPALPQRPYLNSYWSLGERMQVIRTHYELLTGPAEILSFPLHAKLELSPLHWIEEGLRVALDKPPWFSQEGEVALSIFHNDLRLYSLIFSLGIEGGRRVAFVGALQGASPGAIQVADYGKQALDIYRELTRAAHGVRPRDLLFAVFRSMCRELDVELIFAVADRANVAKSGYFLSGASMRATHDDTWMEYGGRPTADGAFFEIPTTRALKPLDEVPTRKRAQYRRRYEMLRRIDDEVQARVREASASMV